MPKPPTSVRSIRLADTLWAMLQAQADSLGVSLNRYVAMRLDGARRDTRTPGARAAEAAPKREAIHVSVPYAGDVKRVAYQKTGKKP